MNSISPSKYIFGEFSDKDQVILIEEIKQKIENKSIIKTNLVLTDSKLNVILKNEEV